MKKVKNAADLKNLVENDGILKNEEVIDEYYHKNDNTVGILYKAKLEFLKDNFNAAIDIISKDYIPIAGTNNYIYYFLTLCYLEKDQYKLANEMFSKINLDEKMNISLEEYKGLKTFIEKQDHRSYTYNDDSYLVNQIKSHKKSNTILKSKEHNIDGTRFLVDDDNVKKIIDKIEKNIQYLTPVKTLDMYDKYYLYYKNIGFDSNVPSNVFMVKTLRNSKNVLYIEPCIPKNASVINDFDNLRKSRYKDFVADDLENEIDSNGLVYNRDYINWLFNKYPYIKSIAVYKIKLECALGNNKEAINIIKEDYLPVFGIDKKIFFILLDLYCNEGKNFEAYKLLKSNIVYDSMDDLFIQKYRSYAFMLQGVLGIIDTELVPNSYLERQLCEYKEDEAAKHIDDYSKSEDSNYSLVLDTVYNGDVLLYIDDLKDDILPELYEKSYVSERKKNAHKTYRNDVLDSYYFYKPFIGQNKETGEYTDYLCVLTKKNTDEIIEMFPVTPKKWYVINDELKDEKEHTRK